MTYTISNLFFSLPKQLRHKKLKAFFFDRNKGAEIFTLAVGGKYVTINVKEKDATNLPTGPNLPNPIIAIITKKIA